MAEPTPKLPSNTTGNLPSYAPISWTAVASLIVAGIFFLIILVTGLDAFVRKQSLIQPWLLFLAVLAVVLAFVARRQIRAAEGTRTGEKYANIAWYLGVIGGLGYLTYLFGIEFAVRNDAEREFRSFTSHLSKFDPSNPVDPEFYSAVYATISPGKRSALRGPTDAETMDQGFKDNVLGFRASDLARLCLRNSGECSFKITGFIDWNQKDTEINCTLKAVLTSPEGEHDLVVPMQAEIDTKKQRRWYIVPTKDGYVKARRLTPYGWELEAIEGNCREIVNGFLENLSRGNSTFAYYAFVDPNGSPQNATNLMNGFVNTAGGRQAAAGSWSVIVPFPAKYEDQLYNGVFAKADGKPPGDYERTQFKTFWNMPQRIAPAGRILRMNVDTYQALAVSGPRLEYSQAAEIVLSPEGQQPPTARARVFMQLSDQDDAVLRARLAKLRAEAAGAVRSAEPSLELRNDLPIWNWRVVKIVTDLKQVPINKDQAPPGGGPGGMMGGMMGGQ